MVIRRFQDKGSAQELYGIGNTGMNSGRLKIHAEGTPISGFPDAGAMKDMLQMQENYRIYQLNGSYETHDRNYRAHPEDRSGDIADEAMSGSRVQETGREIRADGTGFQPRGHHEHARDQKFAGSRGKQIRNGDMR